MATGEAIEGGNPFLSKGPAFLGAFMLFLTGAFKIHTTVVVV